jgi:hypothetical protein
VALGPSDETQESEERCSLARVLREGWGKEVTQRAVEVAFFATCIFERL